MIKRNAVLAYSLALAACGGGGSRDVAVEPAPDPSPGPSLAVQRVFPNLADFSSPVALLQAPGDGSRWFVVEQAGRVMVFDNTSTVSQAATFVDIRTRVTAGGEMGLLGMAFHPGFPADRRVFLSYTNTTSGRVSRISAFTTADNGATLDPASEQILLTVQQPEENHKGGNVAFGPDGYLYIGLGDGGGANDQHGQIGNAQRLTILLGKILRIDVDGIAGASYRIPTDNPFAGNPLCGAGGTGTQECPELYAWGLRNPWRWSFDSQTNELWVGDVGQNAMEEVDRVQRGGNYGWRCLEGTRDTGNGCGSPQNLLPPVAQYGRSLGFSVTGGYVYRGSAIPSLVGRYVFGDYGSGRIWSIPADTAPTLTVSGGFASGLRITSFGRDQDGELYVVHYDGELYKLTGS